MDTYCRQCNQKGQANDEEAFGRETKSQRIETKAIQRILPAARNHQRPNPSAGKVGLQAAEAQLLLPQRLDGRDGRRRRRESGQQRHVHNRRGGADFSPI
jgi:hypothetical protein